MFDPPYIHRARPCSCFLLTNWKISSRALLAFLSFPTPSPRNQSLSTTPQV